MAARTRDGRDQSVVAVVAVGEQLDLPNLFGGQMPELRAGPHQLPLERQELGTRLLPFPEQLADPIADQAKAQLPPLEVLGADQEVNGHAHQRQGGHHRYPGQRRGRGSPLEKDEGGGEHDQDHLPDTQQKPP
jgi:hypothetical protein